MIFLLAYWVLGGIAAYGVTVADFYAMTKKYEGAVSDYRLHDARMVGLVMGVCGPIGLGAALWCSERHGRDGVRF
jgi:hypothetical protein